MKWKLNLFQIRQTYAWPTSLSLSEDRAWLHFRHMKRFLLVRELRLSLLSMQVPYLTSIYWCWRDQSQLFKNFLACSLLCFVWDNKQNSIFSFVINNTKTHNSVATIPLKMWFQSRDPIQTWNWVLQFKWPFYAYVYPCVKWVLITY